MSRTTGPDGWADLAALLAENGTRITRRDAIRRQFWAQNAAVAIDSPANVINTWGDWSLAATVALMNPCSKRCKAWLGDEHRSCPPVPKRRIPTLLSERPGSASHPRTRRTSPRPR